jgi:MFS family permease
MSRDNRLITLALFLWGSGEGLFIYIQPLYMERNLGATPAEVGAVLALAAVLTACAFIPGGWLADRLDPKKVMLGGWALGGLASVWMGLAPNWAAFIPAILLYNVSAYCIPAINTYITEASGDTPLEHTITVTFAGYAAGSIIAPFVGGRLAEAIGTPPLFIIGGVIFFISMLIALQVRSHAAHRHRTTLPLKQQIGHLRPMTPLFVRLSFVFLAMMIGMTLTANYLGKLGWSLGDVDTLGGTAQAIGMMATAIGLGRLAARRQRRGLIAAQALVWSSMLMFLITSPQLRFTAVAGYFLLGGIASSRELANAQIAGQVDGSVRGLAMGLNETLFALARAGAAALAGVLFTLNVQLPLIASLALIPIGMIVIATARPLAPREDVIVMASSGTVVIEPLDD